MLKHCIIIIAALLAMESHADASSPAQSNLINHAEHISNSKTVIYAVNRGDEPAGVHRLFFRGDEEQLEVKIETRASLQVLGLFNIPFIYDSHAIWRGNTLIRLSSSFDQGSGVKEHGISKNGEQYRTEKGEVTTAAIFPTNHWNIAAMENKQTVFFNTLSGNLITVQFTLDGEEELDIGGQKVIAQKYRSSGDLDIALWYGKNAQWLQLQFSVLGSDYTFTRQSNER